MNNMNIIVKIIQTLGKEEVKMLGRWNIDYCNKKMAYKVDLSNEDHCGPCGQYRLNKVSVQQLTTKKAFVPDIE
jgi:hypothetical protein